MFGFDKHEWRVKPCTRLTVAFVNEDSVRHQWMMHGLPKFLYDKGMFHLEVTGPGQVTGTLILPLEDKTYLVHCDIAQHMEKGMKGELIVGKGSGTFPSIPGITDPAIPDYYGPPGGKPAAPVMPVAATAASTATPATTATANPPASTASEEGFFSGWLFIGLLAGFLGAPFLFREIQERCKGKTAAEILGCAWQLTIDLFSALLKLLTWLFHKVSGGKLLPKQ
jgi:plastocyanin